MQTQDMLSKADNFALVTCNESAFEPHTDPRHFSTKNRVDSRLFLEIDHHSHLRRSVRSRETLTLHQNSIGIYRGEFRPENCPIRAFSRIHSVFRDLCRTIRVDPITLGENDHHGHLEGSLGYPGPLTLPQNSIGIYRGEFRPENCPIRAFSRIHSVFRDLCRTIRVDPITLGENDHHGHLEGSLGYPGPLTLPQNSIGSLRGNVRSDLCQLGLFWPS
ncbi:hypothetical protein CRG98_012650 [Punica granatum]|uniref:Uncharacterized protein n=1 Tax=Punica granatum TaxID=22663 RepID=A0A2I0KEQ6_PUNGR|nr:hypothetical protein CRG98_012650 [Punica granatum]